MATYFREPGMARTCISAHGRLPGSLSGGKLPCNDRASRPSGVVIHGWWAWLKPRST
ncbi:MAG: hypothetical protein NTV86_13425 [Planctomycetota bacterium]|nr:hypothetical protein [Planctomycetota bacterium]